MNSGRNRFLTFLTQNISGLNYVMLNYVYDDITQLPQTEPLEILIDKDDYKALLYVLSTAKEINRLKTKKSLQLQLVHIKFSDHSRLVIKIRVSLERKGIVFMNADEVISSSIVDKENIKLPAAMFQFEYLLLTSVLSKKEVEEKYRKHFSKMNFETRCKIFAHIRPRYNFVLNVLDDLYTFNNNYYRKIKKTIRSDKQNTGWRYAWHKLRFYVDYLIRVFVNSLEQIRSSDSHVVNERAHPGELKNLLQRKALIRNI